MTRQWFDFHPSYGFRPLGGFRPSAGFRSLGGFVLREWQRSQNCRTTLSDRRCVRSCFCCEAASEKRRSRCRTPPTPSRQCFLFWSGFLSMDYSASDQFTQLLASVGMLSCFWDSNCFWVRYWPGNKGYFVALSCFYLKDFAYVTWALLKMESCSW